MQVTMDSLNGSTDFENHLDNYLNENGREFDELAAEEEEERSRNEAIFGVDNSKKRKKPRIEYKYGKFLHTPLH